MHPGSADVILCGDRVGIPACIPRLRHPFPQVHRIRGHGTSRDGGTTAAVLRTRGKRSSAWPPDADPVAILEPVAELRVAQPFRAARRPLAGLKACATR